MDKFAIRLDKYIKPGLPTGGESLWKQVLWFFIGFPLLKSYFIPFSFFKVKLLRLFGAKVGRGVRIKPDLRVKFPWLLSIGNHCWIGESVWIDNIESVKIEDQVCISQGVYLCTGNHDWSDPNFGYISKSIHIESESWIAANASVGPGVHVGRGAVLSLGSVTVKSLRPMTIYAGNPAQAIKQRSITKPLDSDKIIL